MIESQGFIVVQKSLTPYEARFNARYRGVDRLVPWTMERYRKGFDDPYESPNYASNEGFIPSLLLAQEVLSILSQVVKPEHLEILWIRERSKERGGTSLANLRVKLLGFDVAGHGSPFYSLVSDFPPPGEAKFEFFGEQLNENGLFDSAEIAKAYLDTYLERYPEQRDRGTVVWEVNLVLEDSKISPM